MNENLVDVVANAVKFNDGKRRELYEQIEQQQRKYIDGLEKYVAKRIEEEEKKHPSLGSSQPALNAFNLTGDDMFGTEGTFGAGKASFNNKNRTLNHKSSSPPMADIFDQNDFKQFNVLIPAEQN